MYYVNTYHLVIPGIQLHIRFNKSRYINYIYRKLTYLYNFYKVYVFIKLFYIIIYNILYIIYI